MRKRRNSSARCRGDMSAITWPEATSSAASQVGGAVTDVVVGLARRHARHQRQHRRRTVERLDLRLLVDAQHDRGLGRVEVQPDDVAHLVDELRIRRELERLDLMRLERKRPPDAADRALLIPVAAAIDRVVQCVASAGCSSSVFTITRSTSSSLIERGLPGRGSSCSPSKPRRAKRPRHRPTVLALQPKSAAISLLDRPSAAANTTRQRNAKRRELFGRRAHRSSVSRSSPLSTTSARSADDRPQSSSIGTTFEKGHRVPAD